MSSLVEDYLENMKLRAIMPISSSSTSIDNTIKEALQHHGKLFGEWAYHTRLLQLKVLDIIDKEQMKSLVKQLNSVDPEAVVLAQTTINNLMKEL